jgi:hypothetical protein
MLNQSIASGRQRLKKSYVGKNALKKSLIGGNLKKSVVAGAMNMTAEDKEPLPDLK